MASSLLLLFLPVLLSTQVLGSNLVVLPAGDWKSAEKQVRNLYSGARICLKDYPKGFALECRNDMTPPVRFLVNNNQVYVATEWPYTLGTQVNGNRRPYTAFRFMETQTIECISSHGGPRQRAKITFGCAEKRSLGDPSGEFSSPVPNLEAKKQTEEDHRRWLWPGSSGCTVVNASNPINGITSGWTREVGGGLTFRAGDKTHDIVPPGTSPLTYMFEVPRHSHYAVTVDMTTRGWGEHNDIFLRFKHGGGLLLRRPGSEIIVGQKYTKAFHNRRGRWTEAKSVDDNGHSFSTVAELVPGTKFYITVGARSTQVTVHSIVLFPCKKMQCTAFDPYWKNTVSTCK